MTSLTLLAMAIFAGYAACYIVLCAASPFGKCRRCQGDGYRYGLLRIRRVCRYCNGTRYRLRLGRRIWTYLRQAHKDSTR